MAICMDSVPEYFDGIQLLTATMAILCGVYFVTCRTRLFSSTEACAIAACKAGIFLSYFLFYYFGIESCQLDDVSYATRGDSLCRRSYPYPNLYIQICGWGMRLLGPLYASPVSVNVIVSAIIACISSCIAIFLMKWDKRKAKIFFLFCCFHPEVAVWSSIYNFKDTYVLMYYVTALYGVQKIFQKEFLKAGLCLMSAWWFVLYFRIYVPTFFYITFLIWSGYYLGRSVIRTKNVLSLCFFACISTICFQYFQVLFFNMIDFLKYYWIESLTRMGNAGGGFTAEGSVVVVMGILRSFGVHITHYVPSFIVAFNLATIPFLLIGGYQFMVRNKEEKLVSFIIILTGVVMGVSASVPEIGTSARHRYQIFFTTAICQFLGLSWTIEKWPLIKKQLQEWGVFFAYKASSLLRKRRSSCS
ncbi:MAG: hypothetical protein LBH38_01535 [Holosporales bacterium]|nr:hypothetical protein [Holosporales bacterium]